MRRSTLFFALVLAAALLAACVTEPPKPQRTQLEIRQFQTREFQTPDELLVLKAVVNVLQDEGYIIENAETALGLITAQKQTDLGGGSGSTSVYVGIFGSHGGFGTESERRYPKTEVIQASVNVTGYSQITRVRANFVKQTLDNIGAISRVEQIEEPEFYRDFFSKVDKGVFLQQEGL